MTDATDLLRLATDDPERAGRELDALAPAERLDVLRALPARERQALLHLSRDPAALVRALEPEELFFTVHEIGADDALELVTLASDEQLVFFLDLECWQRGRLTAERLDRWFVRLGDVGKDELFRALAALDLELLVTFFQPRITVVKRDEDTDATEISDPMLRTLDDLYYFGFPGASAEDDRRLTSTVGLMRERDPAFYLRFMEALRAELPSQVEDDAARLRDGRMLDHGFPDYDHALDLYAYVDPRAFDPERHRKVVAYDVEATPAATGTGTGLALLEADPGSFLSQALAGMEPGARAPLEEELAYLFHRAILVDVEDVTDLADVRRAARDVCRYLSIGLEHVSAGDLVRGREIALALRLDAVLRVGFSLTLALGHRRTRLLERPWLAPLGGRPEALGDVLGEVISALDGPRPAYARTLDDPTENGARPFERLEELGRAAAALTQAEAVASFLHARIEEDAGAVQRLAAEGRVRTGELAAPQLVATLVASVLMGRAASLAPLGSDDLQALHERAFPSTSAGPAQLADGARADVDAWLTNVLADVPSEWDPPLRRFVEESLGLLVEEIGLVDPSLGIDARFVTCVWTDADDDALGDLDGWEP